MCTIIHPIFLFLSYLFLCSFVYLEYDPTPSPCPSMRPASFVNQLNYDLFYCSIYEIFIHTFFICITLCNIASTLIINTKYIIFDKCLDYLLPRLVAKHDWDFILWLSCKITYVYIVNSPLLLSVSEDLHSIITQLAVELLKVNVQTYLNFFSVKYCFPTPVSMFL